MLNSDLWPPGPSEPKVPKQAVHVWIFSTTLGPTTVEVVQRLSQDEQWRAARFRFDRHRRSYAITRWTTRCLLGQYVHKPPDALRFAYGVHRKPSLATQADFDLRFNLSHSGDWALLAITDALEVGVDLEAHRANIDQASIAERFFSQAESAYLQHCESRLSEDGFFRCWTLKEAYLKARGKGLTVPLDHFDLAPLLKKPPTKPTGLLTPESEDPSWFQQLPTPDGFSAALCVLEPFTQAHCFRANLEP